MMIIVEIRDNKGKRPENGQNHQVRVYFLFLFVTALKRHGDHIFRQVWVTFVILCNLIIIIKGAIRMGPCA